MGPAMLGAPAGGPAAFRALALKHLMVQCVKAVLLTIYYLRMIRPLFRLSRQDLPFTEIAFATVAGLRGSVSLILAQAVVIDPATRSGDPTSVVSPPLLSVPLLHAQGAAA